MHAGDAYFFRGEMGTENPRCTPGLRAYQWLMDTKRTDRIRNQNRLRALVREHQDEVLVFSAHDFQEYNELRRAQIRLTRGGRAA